METKITENDLTEKKVLFYYMYIDTAVVEAKKININKVTTETDFAGIPTCT